jgi:hypothetical protein
LFGRHTQDELGTGSGSDSKTDMTSRSRPGALPKDQSFNTHNCAQPQTQTHDRDAAADVARKPTLMDKVKGKAKVISRKLSHAEEKEDDRKRLMGEAID